MFDKNKIRDFLSQVPGVGTTGDSSAAASWKSGFEAPAWMGRNREEYEEFAPTETGPEFPGYSAANQDFSNYGYAAPEEIYGYQQYGDSRYQRRAAEMFQRQDTSLDYPMEDAGGDLDEHGAEKAKISPLQAAWNVTNAIQGMFIVSLPYAVLHGGWWGVVALVGVAAICYYTGVLLVECLYEDGQRIRNSYRAIAEDCWGKPWGGRVVLAAQLTELLMTCILYVVLCGDLMEGSFPGIGIIQILRRPVNQVQKVLRNLESAYVYLLKLRMLGLG